MVTGQFSCCVRTQQEKSESPDVTGWRNLSQKHGDALPSGYSLHMVMT